MKAKIQMRAAIIMYIRTESGCVLYSCSVSIGYELSVVRS
jgi:hypothetical protein